MAQDKRIVAKTTSGRIDDVKVPMTEFISRDRPTPQPQPRK